MGQTPTTWNYEVVDVTQNSSGPRVTVRKPQAALLMGVDGNTQGVLRPFPGFTKVHEFKWENWGFTHDPASIILDVYAVNFKMGENPSYGFVYRVWRPAQIVAFNQVDLYIDYYNPVTGLWVLGTLVASEVGLTPDKDPLLGAAMSVTTWGRFIFIFIELQTVKVVSFGREAPYTMTITTNAGPGRRPTLLSPDRAGALGSLTGLDVVDRSGVGQVVLLEFAPEEVNTNVALGLDQLNTDVRMLEAGDYAFAFVLYNSTNGRRTSLSEIAQVRREDFVPGTEGGVGSGSGSGTGTGTGSGSGSGSSSGEEPVPLYAAIEIVWDTTKYDQAYIYRSVKVQDAGGTYVANILHLDKIITLVDYQTSNVLAENPDEKQAIYYYELEDKALVFQDVFLDRQLFDEKVPQGGSSVFFKRTLVVGSAQGTSTSSAEENRNDDAIRGHGELRWSAVTEVSPELFPPGNRYYPPLVGNKIISLIGVGPFVIGFSKDRQYHIRIVNDLVAEEMNQGFGLVNHLSLDVAGSLCYFVGNKGVKAVDSQGQLSDVSFLDQIITKEWVRELSFVTVAYDQALSAVFFLNPISMEAAVLWLNTAKVTQLTDMTFRQVFRGVWPIDYVHDGTELITNAGLANTTYKNPLTERVFFLQNPILDVADESQTDNNFRHRLYMVNIERNREGDAEFDTMLPWATSPPIYRVSSAFSSGQNLSLATADLSSHTHVVNEDCWGYTVYVLKASAQALVGKKAIIKKRLPAPNAHVVVLSLDTASELYGLGVGDVVGISPVYFEWVGYPVGLNTVEQYQFGQSSDFFRLKVINSVGCSFIDASGVVFDMVHIVSTLITFSSLANFTAAVYDGKADNEPKAFGYSQDKEGNPVQTVTADTKPASYFAAIESPTPTDREGKNGVGGVVLLPAVRIFTPGLDYQMISVMVTGNVREDAREARVS